MHNIYLIGAGGHARVIAEILNAQESAILGIFDRDPNIEQMLGYNVRSQPVQAEWPKNGSYIIAIGNNTVRKRLGEENEGILTFTEAIHPRSIISARASIGKGTVIMAGATINVDASIGKHSILNTNCAIDHDCKLGAYVHISPQVGLAGDVEVGEGTHIGIGASVIPGIKIGKWATIGAGAVIIRDIPDYAIVVGNPGRIIKHNINHHYNTNPKNE